MTILDIIILVIVCLTTVFGIWKGFVRQVAIVTGIVGGYFLACHYYAELAGHLALSDQGIAKILCFVALFVAGLLAGMIVGFLIEKVFKLGGLGLINRLAGGAVGFVKGFIVTALIVIVLITLLPANSPVLAASITVPYVLKGVQMVDRAIPQDIKDQYQRKLDALKDRIFKGVGK